MNWSLTTDTVGATRALGQALGRVALRVLDEDSPSLQGSNAQGPIIVAMVGDLGAGKTALAQGVGAGLGVQAVVVSPTFVLVAEYEGLRPLLHADLYRLSAAELPALGLEEALETWPGVALVEWASRAPQVLPDDHLWLSLELPSGPPLVPDASSGDAINSERRQIVVTATGPFSQVVLRAWQAEVGHVG